MFFVFFCCLHLGTCLLFAVCCFFAMSVGTKGVSRGTVTSAVLHPTFSDSFGSYFNITCGNISGQFCITKFKKNQTKCI